VAASTAATSCHDPVAMTAPCSGSLAAAALSVARDALDERRLMGMDEPDLSALTGTRSGTVGATLRTWDRNLSSMLGGYPKNSDESPNARERVLGTFKHKVRAQRDCNSLRRLHKFPKV
jgi:hypothetical protein